MSKIKIFWSRTSDNDKYQLKKLSNFANFDVEYDGYVYPTVEHAFQSLKYKCSGNPSLVNIVREEIKNKTASEAKTAGGKKAFETKGVMLNFDCWDNIKDRIMRELIESKISRHNQIRNILKEIKQDDILLVHYASGRSLEKRDLYWGAILSEDKKSIKMGENNLGKIYMEFVNRKASSPPRKASPTKKASSPPRKAHEIIDLTLDDLSTDSTDIKKRKPKQKITKKKSSSSSPFLIGQKKKNKTNTKIASSSSSPFLIGQKKKNKTNRKIASSSSKSI